MIARAWHGKVPESKSDSYYAYLLRTGLADYASTAGNRGVWVFRRTENGVSHFLLTTMWESWDAIRKFAGDDFERARYYAEDDDYLLEREEMVTHYELLANA